MCNVHLRLRFNISKKLRIEIKIITFAPEVEGAHDTLNQLHEDIIFSMGHTVATFDEANEAVDHGAKHVTHLYNAATPFEHRDPGVFGAAWTNEQLNTEIIVDGIHSHPASVHIAYKQKEMNTCISSLMRCVRKEWKTVNMI